MSTSYGSCDGCTKKDVVLHSRGNDWLCAECKPKGTKAVKNFLYFQDDGTLPGRLTKIWSVRSSKASTMVLGHVRWHAPWRKYVFFPWEKRLFDPVCLRSIADFCETKTTEHKGKHS